MPQLTANISVKTFASFTGIARRFPPSCSAPWKPIRRQSPARKKPQRRRYATFNDFQAETRMKLLQARKFALSLPEATEEPHFAYTSFRVRGKVFATVPPDGVVMHIFVDDDQRAPLIASHPDVFSALHWGAKVVGIKVLLAQANADTVNRLLTQSWMRKAPKRLAAVLTQAQQ